MLLELSPSVAIPIRETSRNRAGCSLPRQLMAHEIMELDFQYGVEMAWHHLTRVCKEITKELVFPKEIELSRVPIYTNAGKVEKVDGFTLFRSADGHNIGKPIADTYVAFDNGAFWDACTEALSGSGAIVESAGTLFNRSRRFLTIKLADDQTKIGGRTFKNRISFIDSIDGSTFFHCVNTSVCVVCNNTAQAAIGDKSGEFRFRISHRKNFVSRIDNMNEALDSMLGVQAQFNEALRIASSEPLREPDARNLFAGWLGDGASKLSVRAENTVDRLVSLYRSGAGNRGETLLDGISAVTDFYSHESSGGEDKPGFRWKQHLSSEYGAGNRAKSDFISSLFLTDKGTVLGVDRNGIDAMQDRGAKLLLAN
jgi:hypothetical protein